MEYSRRGHGSVDAEVESVAEWLRNLSWHARVLVLNTDTTDHIFPMLLSDNCLGSEVVSMMARETWCRVQISSNPASARVVVVDLALPLKLLAPGSESQRDYYHSRLNVYTS